MQVLIVDDTAPRQADLAVAFLEAGFQTAATGSLFQADMFIRRGFVDLLVIAERVEGRLTHSLALLAEHLVPLVTSFLITPRNDPDLDELYLLLPSLRGIVAPDTAPRTVARLALAALSGAAPARKPVETPLVLEPDMRVATMPVFASVRAHRYVSGLARIA